MKQVGEARPNTWNLCVEFGTTASSSPMLRMDPAAAMVGAARRVCGQTAAWRPSQVPVGSRCQRRLTQYSAPGMDDAVAGAAAGDNTLLSEDADPRHPRVHGGRESAHRRWGQRHGGRHQAQGEGRLRHTCGAFLRGRAAAVPRQRGADSMGAAHSVEFGRGMACQRLCANRGRAPVVAAAVCCRARRRQVSPPGMQRDAPSGRPVRSRLGRRPRRSARSGDAARRRPR